MTDPYVGREQTKAKHFILRSYLQALAFKVLTFQDITFVDGFSGPWETKTENFEDSSFKIAMEVLQDAQKQILDRDKQHRRIRCFFVEKNPEAFAQLQEAVAPFHSPADKFEISTYCGEFEDAVVAIQRFIGSSFSLIFIDPTGWTGYSFAKIKPLFSRSRCEVLINFMYEFINRFASSENQTIVTSLDSILGGQGWRNRLDPNLLRGAGVEKLFRESLKEAGGFRYVVSTKIDKATAERPHFFITYGTKSPAGLITFRDVEYRALRQHERNRASAKNRQRENRTGIPELFSDFHADVQAASVDEIVRDEIAKAKIDLLVILSKRGVQPFDKVVIQLLEPYMLRETNVKEICVDLAKAGKIRNSWGSGNRRPKDDTPIAIT